MSLATIIQALSGPFSLLADFATVVGVPIALLLYRREKERDRRDKEYGTYHALDEKYLDFLKLCVDRPELRLYPRPRPLGSTAPRALREQQQASFEVLISILERAYLMYTQQRSEIREAQWTGWARFLDRISSEPEFWHLWERIGASEFDGNFAQYVHRLRA